MSWSQKLFFKINSYLGKNKWRDYFFLYTAHILIYLLGLAVVVWGYWFLDSANFKLFIKLLLTACFFGFIDNWLIALIWQHPRPKIQFPEAKVLFKAFENFKAFPSDHTTISFIFVFITLFFHPVLWFGLLIFLVGCLIGISRVYCGVHYPRDIVGGIIFALAYSWLAFWLLEYVSQPVYVWLVSLFF